MNFLAYCPIRFHSSSPPCWYVDRNCFDDYQASSHWRRSSWGSFSDFNRVYPSFEKEHRCTRKSSSSGNIEKFCEENKPIYTFDLSGFEPKDIKVKAIGHKLVVDAETEMKDQADGCSSIRYKQFHSSVILPENVSSEDIKTTLNDQGILCITAPLVSHNNLSGKVVTIEREEKTIDLNPSSESS